MSKQKGLHLVKTLGGDHQLAVGQADQLAALSMTPLAALVSVPLTFSSARLGLAAEHIRTSHRICRATSSLRGVPLRGGVKRQTYDPLERALDALPPFSEDVAKRKGLGLAPWIVGFRNRDEARESLLAIVDRYIDDCRHEFESKPLDQSLSALSGVGAAADGLEDALSQIDPGVLDIFLGQLGGIIPGDALAARLQHVVSVLQAISAAAKNTRHGVEPLKKSGRVKAHGRLFKSSIDRLILSLAVAFALGSPRGEARITTTEKGEFWRFLNEILTLIEGRRPFDQWNRPNLSDPIKRMAKPAKTLIALEISRDELRWRCNHLETNGGDSAEAQTQLSEISIRITEFWREFIPVKEIAANVRRSPVTRDILISAARGIAPRWGI